MTNEPLVDVSPEHWKVIGQILRKHVPDREVWAFGSRAKWTAKPYSDLDLAVIGDAPLSLEVITALEDDFSEFGIPWKVDVVDWATTTDGFRKVIERDKVVVQTARKNGARNWRHTRIADIAQRTAIGPFGSRLKSDCYTSTGVPVIRGTNLTGGRSFSGEWVYVSEEKADELSGSNVSAGDLVFPHRGAIGEVGIVPDDRDRYLLSSSLMMLRSDRAQVDPLYLFYFFRSAQGQHELLKNASQVGTPGIGQPLSSLRGIELFLPPIEQQRAIAHILGTLDDKIELNRRSNETLEAMARALFKDWFVDFGPVRAKLEGRERYLASELWSLFPDALDDDEVPGGWVHAKLGDTAPLNSESWSAKDFPSTVEYVDLANTKWGVIESTSHFAWADAPSRARRVLREGDTIVGTVRPGNGSYCYVGRDGLTGSTGFAVLRPKVREFRELVYLAATSVDNIERLSHLADGGAYPAVRPEVVAATQLVRPDERIIAAFSGIASPILAGIERAKQESRALATLRDTLLPKLLSGELRIRDAEKLLADAA